MIADHVCRSALTARGNEWRDEGVSGGESVGTEMARGKSLTAEGR